MPNELQTECKNDYITRNGCCIHFYDGETCNRATDNNKYNNTCRYTSSPGVIIESFDRFVDFSFSSVCFSLSKFIFFSFCFSLVWQSRFLYVRFVCSVFSKLKSVQWTMNYCYFAIYIVVHSANRFRANCTGACFMCARVCFLLQQIITP